MFITNPYINGINGTGGTITRVGGRTIHTFLTSGTFVAIGSGNIDVLIVAGGGGGGMDMGGGGGGGGVQYKTNQFIQAGSYNIVVGLGGAGAPAAGTNGQPGSHQFTIPAQKGQNSSAFGFTSEGGGYGGSSCYDHALAGMPGNGGSGGGASGYTNNSATRNGGTGVSGQGYRGGNGFLQYYSGGGGGAGGPGIDSPTQADGGPGFACSITGTPYYRGGGGGGSGYTIGGGNGGIGGGGGGAVGTGGIGGTGLNNGQNGTGGPTVAQANVPGGNGGTNTGGGGGGGSHYTSNNKGGDGGSGIIVISYLT